MNSLEHQSTDKLASFLVGENRYFPDNFRFERTYPLSYGQIVALAGDYFKNFHQLRDAAKEPFEEILKSEVYNDLSHWDRCFFIKQPVYHTSYYLLAIFNPEHFRGTPIIESGKYISNPSDDSVIVYMDGHEAAIRHAQNTGGDESAQRNSYAINAFYDHFLTDMFSSGHMRVPRRQLHYIGSSSSVARRFSFLYALVVADLFTARLMHDEDGETGLWVTNMIGDIPWKAKGDGKQTKDERDTNWSKCLTGVKLSVEEVEEALNGLTIRDRRNFQALGIKPEVYPPGARIHEKSKISDYKVEMNPIPDKKEEFFFYVNDVIESPGLIIPKYLVDRFKNEKKGPGIFRYALLHQNWFVSTRRSKQLYKLETNYLRSANDLGREIDDNQANSTQTCPMYAIANGRLFVRVGSSGVFGQEKYNHYVTAETIFNDPDAYDRSSPPPMKERLQGRHQGIPVP
jgi:hypothetical protein